MPAPRLPVLALLAALAACSSRPRPEPAFLDGVLPAGTYRAEVQRFGIPKDLADAQARLAAAMAARPEWLLDWLARHGDLKPGELLPYHAEMGITREEYEALGKAYQHPQMAPAGTFELRVEVAGGTVRLGAPAPYGLLDGLQIDRAGVLRGPRGLELRPEAVEARQARFGAWSGHSWFLESGDPATGDLRLFELAVGRLDGAGRPFVYCGSSVVEGKQRVADDQVLAFVTREAGPAPAR